MTKLLTGRQANVLDHAVAYPKMTRSQFRARKGSLNEETWKELVTLGYAEINETETHADHVVFSVTSAGVAAICDFHNSVEAAENEESRQPKI